MRRKALSVSFCEFFKKLLKPLGYLAILGLLGACRTLSPAGEAPVEPKEPGRQVFWQVKEEGLLFSLWEDPQVPQRIFLIRADLDKWEPIFTRPQDPAENRYLYPGVTVTRFLRETQTQAAVNGGPFFPYRNFPREGMDTTGLVIWNRRILSEPRPGWSALAILPGGGLVIGFQEDLMEAEYALGGFQKLLEEGEVRDLSPSPRRPRTVLGLDREGRTLWLMVADGDNPRYSRGLTTRECAAWLKALGAWEGMNLDGGGSSAMAFRDGRGRPRLMNRPPRFLGQRERIVANHLGLRRRN
ncbi:MAG: phosphodiester glycosidase family protein [Spirochaetales bacterium]|nr:phosphodiester glycosidase family protein [Spirochaetales bacterium]